MTQEHPNVLLLISDQWSTRVADGSGDYNNGIQTPGIDRLASEGIRFEQSYSSFPLCCPARSSMFTGLMPHKHQIIDNEEVFMDKLGAIPARDDLTTMGQLFKEAGYETAYFGKEHAAGYAWDGNDEFGSMKYSAGGMLAEGSAYDQIFTRDAINFIKREHDRPFYATLSLINPHDICKVLGGKVKGATFADAIFFCRTDDEPYLRFQERPGLPSNFDAPVAPGMIRDREFMYEELDTWTESDWRRYLATYMLLIEKTDWYIELLLDALRDAGLDENTLVVFTTDHGDMVGSHGIIAKTAFYEESVRTQLLMRYPDHIAPSTVDSKSIVGSIDLMPTLLDFCGIEAPAELDGQSFKALCCGADAGDFSQLVSVNPDGRMLRFEHYKYIHSAIYDEEREILFDLKVDPDETTNVFNRPGYEEASAYARATLDNWLAHEALSLRFEEL
ncbi:MAG: sulfatase-like hydrolase/transferase [Chloroflexi bacterium]|jgi:arylsulfatase A-like enzyme|nr:sulfatase-like hydrolase/transferase [Chloroflexota bacterium]